MHLNNMEGNIILGHEIRHKIGEGQLSEVFFAQVRPGYPAVLKILKPAYSAEESLRQRFEQEARLLSKVVHPLIERAFDLTEHQGRPAFFLKYLTGQDLGAYVREKGPLSLDLAARLWADTMKALNYAHRRGLLYRNIKPSNLFLTEFGGLGLLDFGLSPATPPLAQTGTACYLSPEQRSNTEPLTPASDYYSLGATFYYLLTGELPYGLAEAAPAAVRPAIQQGGAVDLSRLPEEWCGTLANVLRKEPGARICAPRPQREAGGPFVKSTLAVPRAFPPQMPSALPKAVQELAGNMVWVEGGTFMMGGAAEQGDGCRGPETPVHEVSLDGFWISRYPVTQALWAAVVGGGPEHFKGCPECPVKGVGWLNVRRLFLHALNEMTGGQYRLPTEAEWEYAARGGRQSRGYTFSGSDDLGRVAWYAENSGGKAHPVGLKAPNELGLYDMSGNVWEWCSDTYAADYYSSSPLHNPQGRPAGTSHVFRGGSYESKPSFCRVAFRFGMSSSMAPGFRLAASPLPKVP